jgi:hypothetical protein
VRILCCSALLALSLASACARDAKGDTTNTPGSTQLRVVVAEGDADAELWVDGNYVGQLGEFEDERVGRPLLAPGVHRVEVRKPGRFPVQTTVEVAKDAPAEVVLEAELLADPR